METSYSPQEAVMPPQGGFQYAHAATHITHPTKLMPDGVTKIPIVSRALTLSADGTVNVTYLNGDAVDTLPMKAGVQRSMQVTHVRAISTGTLFVEY